MSPISKKPQREAPLVVSGAHSVFTNIIQIFGALLVTILIARLLGPANKGVFDLYFTLAALLNVVLQFSVNSGITYAIASHSTNLRRLIAGVITFAALQGAIAGGIVVSLSHLPRGRAFIPAQLGALAPYCVGAGVASLALFAMSRAILAGQRRFITANYGDMMKQGIGIMLILIVYGMRRHLSGSTLLAIVIANFSALLLASLYFFRSIDFTRAGETASAQVKTIMTFAAPAFAANVMQYLNYRLDVFLVSYYRGTAAVGLYQIGVYVVLAINMIPQTVQSVLFPTISSRNGHTQRNAEIVAISNRILTAFGLLFGLTLAVVMPVGIPLALGESYRGSVPALLWLLPGSIAFITANVTAAYFSGIGRQSINTVGSAIGLSLTLGLDFLLIPKFSFVGAACASSISYAAAALYSSIMFARVTGTPYRDLYVLRSSDKAFMRQIMQNMKQKFLLPLRGPIPVAGDTL